ncbi:hypothetical protein M011DRAFT_56557 [Sporormia fimetaria CBS 119925]|uniref:Uncharacterized protein n=1 Tax=Sporormia fimetaria CBS 119925 TaxID=1340428 RepID=A0A6A6VB51_9PLEO|nr:hypothetical protein M011DRAFT_56557 [Sporormia fimetaria CBS 119925]
MWARSGYASLTGTHAWTHAGATWNVKAAGGRLERSGFHAAAEAVAAAVFMFCGRRLREATDSRPGVATCRPRQVIMMQMTPSPKAVTLLSRIGIPPRCEPCWL